MAVTHEDPKIQKLIDKSGNESQKRILDIVKRNKDAAVTAAKDAGDKAGVKAINDFTKQLVADIKAPF